MESKSFITQKLADFARKFGDYSYRYWIDDTEENHFIEVIPSSYKIREDFINEEVELLDNFYSNYFEDSLSFVTSEDLKGLGELKLVQIFQPEFCWDDFSIKLDLRNYKLSDNSSLKHVICPNSNYSLAA